jgi:hypothetical protein
MLNFHLPVILENETGPFGAVIVLCISVLYSLISLSEPINFHYVLQYLDSSDIGMENEFVNISLGSKEGLILGIFICFCPQVQF